MLLKCDAAQLEWRTKVYLAQDKVGMKEIIGGEDLHSDNQEAFKLPSRLIAKKFVYRMIFADAFGEQGFRGPAYAYANDLDFIEASSSVKYWEGVVEKFFEKYPGIHEHSLNLIREATSNGMIVSPSGRFYRYSPRTNKKGVPDWPRTEILNHIVQGLSADFVQVARLLLRASLLKFTTYKPSQILMINTVHDSIDLDLDNIPDLVYNISLLLEDCFRRIPERFEQLYGINVNVPMAGEVKFGWNMSEKSMVKFNKQTFREDWIKYNEHHSN